MVHAPRRLLHPKRIPSPRSATVYSEQQALLDAIPDATCVLDGDGVIVKVNKAWRMMALDNGGDPDATGVGVDYLAVCARAAAAGCLDAGQAETAVRSVLAGHSADGEYAYACPSPSVGRFFLLRATPIAGSGTDAQPGVLVSHMNVTRQKAAEQELERRASHDPLTGLANRALLEERLTDALTQRPDRAKQADVGVLFLDLDGFKPVNDTFGHTAGDEVLLAVAARLRQVVRPQDTVARYGGDEFAIIAPRITVEGLHDLEERILQSLDRPHQVHGQSVTVPASVGTHLAMPGEEANDALHAADLKMYQSKHSRRG